MHVMQRTGPRRAFTLVELMVAMALTLFVMVVLTQAFSTSLASFSQLKAIGELQANLRTASSLLQADLAADHFEGTRRLSSPDLQTIPPVQGFFCVYQGSAPGTAGYVIEGYESGTNNQVPGLRSCRATNHALYFTVRLRGNQLQDLMTAPLPAGAAGQPLQAIATPYAGASSGYYSSRWAEVCYFLVQTGSTDPTTGIPTYALYRSQNLLVVNPTGPTTVAGAAQPPLFSTNTAFAANTLMYNAPEDVAANAGWRMFPTLAATGPPAAAPPGAALVLSNVTSFQVQIFTNPSLVDPVTGAASNLPWNPPPPWADFGDLPAPTVIYDTSSPPGYSLLAVKVTIRIFDPVSQLSRQVTIVQNM